MALNLGNIIELTNKQVYFFDLDGTIYLGDKLFKGVTQLIDILRKRIILFIIQILLLNVLVIIIGYEFTIDFDEETSKTQELIIQFLANFMMFDNIRGFYFIYISWLLISLIPIFLFNNFKKASSMNLLTLFFPCFFFLVFLKRYAKIFFDSNFYLLIGQTIILGIVIIVFSICFSLLLKKLIKSGIESQMEDLLIVANRNKRECPNCGTLFDSIPNFCYNCNADLTMLTSNENKTNK
ncbi:MAG: hypothetical protein ACFFC3_12060 [Candidatus Odinarchaeota archaeon]